MTAMELDTLDFVVLVGASLATAYFVYSRFFESGGSGSSAGSASTSSSASPRGSAASVGFQTAMGVGIPQGGSGGGADDGDLVANMKRTGAQVAIFYGSQTGTAEDFSLRLAREAKRFGITPIVADIQDYEMDCLKQVATNLKDAVMLFCVATYGEGEPTDNAIEFFNLLKEQKERLQESGGAGGAGGAGGDDDDDVLSLSGLKFGVFGLGNRTYDHFNAMGILVDDMLSKLGGERIVELGQGDDDANMEEDFVNWKDQLWPKVCEVLGKDPTETQMLLRQYELRPDLINQDKIFTGEPHFYGSFSRQKRPFTQKNPFLAKVNERRELYDDDDRSCLHIELDVAGSSIRCVCVFGGEVGGGGRGCLVIS